MSIYTALSTGSQISSAECASNYTVPCKNEDLPDRENAPDFDENTLQGELSSTSASIIVRTISIRSVSRILELSQKRFVRIKTAKQYFCRWDKESQVGYVNPDQDPG